MCVTITARKNNSILEVSGDLQPLNKFSPKEKANAATLQKRH